MRWIRSIRRHFLLEAHLISNSVILDRTVLPGFVSASSRLSHVVFIMSPAAATGALNANTSALLLPHTPA